jgi:alginate O-acetyltransferase complex protein AlgJ
MESPANRLSWLAPAIGFGAALALGFAAALYTLTDDEQRDLPAATASSVWNGAWAQAISQRVNEGFVARKSFHHVERSLQWLVLRDWGARVREGCRGWLFLADELELHRDRRSSAHARAEIVARLRDALARDGVALVVAVVPDKSRIESAHLCDLERPPEAQTRVARWVGELRAQGVTAVDLSEAISQLPGERYYRSDTHWTEPGADAAARAIADALRARGLAPQRPAPAPLSPRMIERPGDLVRVAGLDALPRGLGPAPDLAESRDVPPIAAASDDLFGDSALPKVTVVGTSFSRTSNLVPFLARHLGEQVANAAKDGADFDGAAAAYVASPAFRDSRPRVVVWEIPERAIEPPVKPSERDWMKKIGR